MTDLLAMAAAGLAGGAMNAIAGGGSFVTFPAMVLAGLPPVIANASSTVALFPGTVASSYAYRRDLRSVAGYRLSAMAAISVVGGLAGAMLLLATPAHLFDAVVPVLCLLATLTFAFGARAGLALRRVIPPGPRAVPVTQAVIAVYGGYFGGAVGLMMMASWSLLTASGDLKSMTPARVLLTSAANAAAVVWFVLVASIRWPETLSMLGGAIAGGYAGALIGRRLPPRLTRGAVIVLMVAVTLSFFLRLL